MEEKIKVIGQVVYHKVFGIGVIIQLMDERIIVAFSCGDKKFIYPDVFEKFLQAKDDTFNDYVNKLILKRKPAKPPKKESDNNTSSKQYGLLDVINEQKDVPRSNIAFKCNFCDGGKSKKQVGFDGVCSDYMIEHNIEVEKRSWCTNDNCPCFQYYNNEMTRAQLVEMCEDGGYVCYESQMLRDWKAFAGYYSSGAKAGQPMKLQKVQKNSLCVLTTKNPGMKESERYIFAVFLVDEANNGDEEYEGYVKTKSKYKIKLSPKQSEKMLFWNYHSNKNSPSVPRWYTGLHRYFDDNMAVQILRDIAQIKKGTNEEKLAKEFLEYFCRISHIKVENVDEPKGALTMG